MANEFGFSTVAEKTGNFALDAANQQMWGATLAADKWTAGSSDTVTKARVNGTPGYVAGCTLRFYLVDLAGSAPFTCVQHQDVVIPPAQPEGWYETAAFSWAETSGHTYCLAVSVIAGLFQINIAATSAGQGGRAVSGTETSDATFSPGYTPDERMLLAADVTSGGGGGSSALTDVDGDETIYPGQANVSYTGTGLSTAASARLSSTNTSATSSMALSGVSGTGGTIDAISLGTGVPYTDANHALTLDIRSASASLATIAVTVSPEAGYAVYPVSTATANTVVGESALAGVGTIPANSQAKIPTTVTISGTAYTLTPELSSGYWTGRLTIAGYAGTAPGSVTGAYLPGGGVWEALPLTLQVADTTAPTLSSATINTAGAQITLAFSEAVQIGSGGSAGVALSMSGGAVAATYVSGSGTSALVYSLSRAIAYGETGTYAYTQPGNGIEDVSGNDLATTSGAVTNGVSAPVVAGMYYLDVATGSNSDNGTSWALAWATLAYALANTTQGDRIRVKAGTYPWSGGPSLVFAHDTTLLRTASATEIKPLGAGSDLVGYSVRNGLSVAVN